LKYLITRRNEDLLAQNPRQGWRTRAEVGNAIGDETGWPLEVETVSTYVSEIIGAIRSDVERRVPGTVIPTLIERETNTGVRIAFSADVQVE
jgi:hypothetical protein